MKIQKLKIKPREHVSFNMLKIGDFFTDGTGDKLWLKTSPNNYMLFEPEETTLLNTNSCDIQMLFLCDVDINWWEA